jgi:hypothetical protein
MLQSSQEFDDDHTLNEKEVNEDEQRLVFQWLSKKRIEGINQPISRNFKFYYFNEIFGKLMLRCCYFRWSS